MWDLIGQDSLLERLDRMFEAATVPHAMLLVGPSGIGKTTLALEVAKALNCTGERPPPCQVCLHCRQIAAGTHPGAVLVEAAEGRDSIAILQVRQMRDAASLRPFQGTTKVFVIAGAEALTAQAADALLKTLEDPQPNVCVLLTSVDEAGLPETVVSRCTVLRLRPIATATLAEELARRGVAREEADRLPGLSMGSVGWALGAAKQPKLAVQREEMLDRLSRVPDIGLEERLNLAESLTADRKDRASVRRIVEILALLARETLLAGQGVRTTISTGDEIERSDVGHDDVALGSVRASAYATQAPMLGLQHAHAYLEGIRLAMERIDSNVDPRLTLEALFLGLSVP